MEILINKVDGNGMSVAFTHDMKKGYQVSIVRPDGTSEFKKVSGKPQAIQVISEIVGGRFKEGPVQEVAPELVTDSYYCEECQHPHKRTSKIGKAHYQEGN